MDKIGRTLGMNPDTAWAAGDLGEASDMPLYLRPSPPKCDHAPPPPMRYARRALIVSRITGMVVTLVLLALLGRVLQLQIDPPEPVARLVDSQFSSVELPGRRGPLLDRRHRVFASTSIANTLFVDPWLIEEPVTFAEHVGYTLDYDPARIERMIGMRLERRYVVLDRELDDNRLARLSTFRPAGLGVRRWLQRSYPHGPLAGQVIGFTGAEERGVEGRGLEGIEQLFDGYLRGQSGQVEFLRDARRRPLWVSADGYEPPKDGRSVRLSLDITIQTIAEEELAATCRQYSAKSGQIIVMEPYTGEILAMANWPPFDPNDLAESTADDWRNRCVTDVFEPGSTFKPFVWAMATQGGYARVDEIIDCGPGYYLSPFGRRLRDASGHGAITWAQVLEESSNIGMAIVAQRMGERKLREAVTAFGFGRSTGSGLPGEVAGIVNPLSRWNHYSVTSVPMGQEVSVTALQITTAFCALANGGSMVCPTMIAMDEREPLASAPIYERLLTPEIAETTKQILRKVVTDGTGRKIKDSPYAIFGKTGTAQMPNIGGRGYREGKYIAGFVGSAPLDRPRIVVACFVQEPDRHKGYYGGIVSAPTVQRVMEQTLIYMGVPPQPRAGEVTRAAMVHGITD